MISLEKLREQFPDFFKKNKFNFFTPKIIGYEITDKYIIELSTGAGLMVAMHSQAIMYGVTVFDKNTFKNTNLSKPFFNYREAKEYIASLC